MRCAIDAQADPLDTPETRLRKLEKVAGKIDYWQAHRRRSEESHRKRAIREFHRLGIALRDLRRCSGGDIAL